MRNCTERPYWSGRTCRSATLDLRNTAIYHQNPSDLSIDLKAKSINFTVDDSDPSDQGWQGRYKWHEPNRQAVYDRFLEWKDPFIRVVKEDGPVPLWLIQDCRLLTHLKAHIVNTNLLIDNAPMLNIEEQQENKQKFPMNWQKTKNFSKYFLPSRMP